MAQNSRRQEDLDLDLMYLNHDSLARKADIMQYPKEAQARQLQRGMEPQRRKSSGKIIHESKIAGAEQHTDGGKRGAGRRNPYLADYNSRSNVSRGAVSQRKRSRDDIDLIWGEEIEHPIRRGVRPPAEGNSAAPGRVNTSGTAGRREAPSRPSGAAGTAAYAGRTAVMPDMARPVRRPEQVSNGEQRRRMQQERRRRELRRRKLVMGVAEVMILAVIIVLVALLVRKPKEEDQNIPAANPVEDLQSQENVMDETVQGLSREVFDKHPEWTTDYLTPNEYSRPGEPLGTVKNLFVHYTANKNTSAKQNRSYFEQLKDTHERGASAHFIIGYEGEIIQCVPLDEIAYAVATRNEDSISIECCFTSDDGSFTQETYDSLIALLSWLTEAYGLESEDILRHYDCGGKKCPIYYTENEDAWEKLKADVRDYTL